MDHPFIKIEEDCSSSSSSQVKTTEPRWFKLIKVLVAFTTAMVLSYCGKKVLLNECDMFRSDATSSTKKDELWRIPSAYQVRVKLTLPYSGLVEDSFVMMDSLKGKQRISYYNGRNVFINDASVSYMILPYVDKVACFIDPAKDNISKVQDVFPKDLDTLFSKVQTSADDVHDVYIYEQTAQELGDEDAYVGKYHFFVDKKTGVPVKLHFVGHNIFLGGSHFDEYIFEYSDFQDLSNSGGVSDFQFLPPNGMDCVDKGLATEKGDAADSEAQQTARRNAQVQETDHDLLFPGRYSISQKEKIFREHIRAFNLTYNSLKEYRFRKRVFHANRRHVNARNRAFPGYTLAVNEHADKTDRELEAMRGGVQTQETLCKVDTVKLVQAQKDKKMAEERFVLPRKVDYVNDIPLSLPPGDQGSCGSCWAFGATGAIEAAVARKTGNITSVSKQMLMDCTKGVPFNSNGCNGGTDFKGYEWIINNNEGRFATEASYPYTNQDGFCQVDPKRGLKSKNKIQFGEMKLKDCFVVTERFLNMSEVSTKQSVDSFVFKLATEGPLSISINATPKDFYFYHSGIFSDASCDPSALDHIVLAVGYNLDENYMVLRNSWSSNWGENGYARLKLDDNTCGFASLPSYVHVG